VVACVSGEEAGEVGSGAEPVGQQTAQHHDIGQARRGRQQLPGRRAKAFGRIGVGGLGRRRQRCCRRGSWSAGDIRGDQQVAGEPVALLRGQHPVDLRRGGGGRQRRLCAGYPLVHASKMIKDPIAE
jgi:hypothetical protein